MTMSLFEAIEHAEQKANDESCCCRDEHAQLAEWLKELALRRFASNQSAFSSSEYLHLCDDLSCVKNGYDFDYMKIINSNSVNVVKE